MPATNALLDAATAALEAQPYPWFLPGYSIRLTDNAIYQALIATYGFGTPVIIGLSPAAAAALTGAPLLTDHSASSQATRPAVYVDPSQASVLGVAISTSDSGGTVLVPYTTPFGRFDRVVWQWQCDVEFDPAVVPQDPVLLGKWEQQVIPYTGTGIPGRHVDTTFSLATGTVGVWVLPEAGSGIQLSCFRHSGMAQAFGLVGGLTATGITGFDATGFTVTDSANAKTNTLGALYTALVIRDSTSDNRYLRVGSYAGTDLAHLTSVGGSNTVTQVWLFGYSGAAVFCSEDFPVGNSYSENAATSITNVITSLGAGSFGVGTGALNYANNSGLTYYYVAFTFPVGDSVRSLLKTYKIAGTGGVVQVTGLGFTPAFATARALNASATPVWRGPQASALTSVQFDDETPIVGGGIRAFGSGTLDIGSTVAVSGQDCYGFAMASSGSVSVPDPNQPPGPDYTPPYPPVTPGQPRSFVPPGGYVPTGVLLTPGEGIRAIGVKRSAHTCGFAIYRNGIGITDRDQYSGE